MKKIRTKFYIVIVSLLLIFILTSCSTTSNNLSTTTTINPTSISTTQEGFKRNIMIPEEVEDCELPELDNGYKIVWCDEFNYEGLPDEKKWSYNIGNGDGGWGNGESQYYTSRAENVYVSDGSLKITTLKEKYNGYDYTSARILSRNKGDFKYGIVEARIMLPEGKGTWPAFWMMPTSSEYGGWPKSGEIDIMEATGNSTNRAIGAIHTENFNHLKGTHKSASISVQNSSSTYNIYRLEWLEDQIIISVNGNKYLTFNNSDTWKNATNAYMYYPFDKEFYVILNVAMGGSMGGAIDSTFTKSEMLVDYVRVYQKGDDSDTVAPEKVEIKDYSSSGSTISLEWDNALDNDKIRQYEVIVNNKQVAALRKNSYVITDLNPNETYNIQILAADFANNYSISDVYPIKTVGTVKVPGKISLNLYSSLSDGIIIDGPDGEAEKILRVPGSSIITYQVETDEAKAYSLKLRASVLRNIDIKIYTLGNLENSTSESLNASYGKYTDIKFEKSLSLSEGLNTIVLEVGNTSTLDSLLLNYLLIE